jgi:hypothetical protein
VRMPPWFYGPFEIVAILARPWCVRDNDWSKVLGCPGYKVSRHEIDERGKRPRLWVRRKRANKLLDCSGCGKSRRHEVPSLRAVTLPFG